MFKTLFEGPRFEYKDTPKTALEVIGWWESRRLFFNMIVGCTGIISCILIVLYMVVSDAALGEPIGLPDGPFLRVFGIVVYGILANLCYTGGWILQLLVRASSTTEGAGAFGLCALRIGVKFSVWLTLVPAAGCWILFAAALISGHKPHAISE